MTDIPPLAPYPIPTGGRVLVFDSGVGGLTVAQEIMALAPDLAVDYSADTGFFPYGDKSDDALRARIPAVAGALYEVVRPDVFVIACNTASTLALPEVRAALPCPVVGTVPAFKPAAQVSQSGVIGLLATPGTIKRAYTDQLIQSFASEAQIIKHGSVELVKLAERHARGEEVPLSAFAELQLPVFDAPGGDRIDTMVLACTHFPLVRDQLEQTAPRKVTYIDSGAAIARQTLRLVPDGREKQIGGRGYITDDPKGREGLIETLRRFGFADVKSVEIAQPDSERAAS